MFASIDLFTLKNPRLQYIFNAEIDELKKSFLDLKKTVNDRDFKCDALIAFWLCVELEKLEEAKFLSKMEPIVAKTIKNIRENGHIVKKKKYEVLKRRET